MPGKVCNGPGCLKTATKGERYCLACGPKAEQQAKATSRQREQRRGSSTQRGYDAAWQRFVSVIGSEEPLCRVHEAIGQFVATEHFDHIVPISGRTDPLRLDRANVWGLCRDCHTLKTKRFDEMCRAMFDGRATMPVVAGGHESEGTLRARPEVIRVWLLERMAQAIGE